MYVHSSTDNPIVKHCTCRCTYYVHTHLHVRASDKDYKLVGHTMRIDTLHADILFFIII